MVKEGDGNVDKSLLSSLAKYLLVLLSDKRWFYLPEIRWTSFEREKERKV